MSRLCVTTILLFVGFWNASLHATTIDMSPRPAILLPKSEQFIAQDAMNSLALYRYGEGEPVRRFQVGPSINEIDVTADEQMLLIACDTGEVSVWNIETGERIWSKPPSKTGLTYIYGAAFSQDGRSLAVCNRRDYAVVFNAVTGEKVGGVAFPPMQTNIMSVALSPDGARGAFVNLGERVFTFETATGRMKDTGLKGAWPVKYSADGKRIAFRNNNSGSHEKLRIVSVSNLAVEDVGQFDHIGHIKPTEDGGFLATARVAGRNDDNPMTVGVKYEPATGELKELWRLPADSATNRTDFDVKRMIGVSTDFLLVTRLIDLPTGNPHRTVDNHANYRETVATYTSADLPSIVRSRPLWLPIGGITVLAMLGFFFVWLLRGRKVTSDRS
jgi:DNA-binding beta-propeller fold protein YncE